MAFRYENPTVGSLGRRALAPGLILMLVPVFIGVLVWLLSSDFSASLPYFFLLPWILALGLVLAAPSTILVFQGRFRLHDPLVFATWSYFVPAFFIGGLILTFGWSQPYFLSFIQDPKADLTFTIALIMLGYAGLSAGYFLSVGRRVGTFVKKYLPEKPYSPSSMIIPGLVLMSAGVFTSVWAFFIGLFGFQLQDESGPFDGLVILLTFFWLQGSFLLWCIVFSQQRFDARSYVLMAVLIVTALGKAVYAGNRGSLLQLVIVILLAYTLSGRRFSLAKSLWAGLIVIVSLFVGMIYGSTFRTVKGTESRVDVGQYTESVFQTIEQVQRNQNLHNFEYGLMTLAERLDAVSSLGVLVSNYERLRPYEESYGLDENIRKDILTFFVPRAIWNDKPLASDPRKYSDLYFQFGESSFTVTPIGDLIRNFGIAGVFIGMGILGIVLRALYNALIEDRPSEVWRSTLYFMLIISVSYEGFYGAIFPYLFKVGFIAIIGVLAVNFFSKQTESPVTV
jgi:hypothetical protein